MRIGFMSLVVLGVLAPVAAFARQGAELYRTQAQFYGRFEARVRFAPGDGVVSSFFLWKDGSSSTTSWNELDYEKINVDCRLQTNIWTGKGTQSAEIDTPSFNICTDYHTYAFDWTPDAIVWSIDGAQVRKVTGASVAEYTKNAAAGMAIHFNLWEGDKSFGGTLDPSILPVREYINWVQYSSYTDGGFKVQWREDFDGSSMPSGWAVGNWASPNNLSTHNPANVSFVDGIAVLSLTADGATGFSGKPPMDTSGGSGRAGTGGSTGTGGAASTGGASGRGGASANGGRPGAGGIAASGGMVGTGGATGTGGLTSTGGATGTGGLTGTGGVTATGGSSTTGGTGGAIGTGGATSTGGRVASGGAVGSGGKPISEGTGGAPSGGGAQGGGSGCSCSTVEDGTVRDGTLLMLLLFAAPFGRRRRSDRSRSR